MWSSEGRAAKVAVRFGGSRARSGLFRAIRGVALGTALAAPLALAGCTGFTPVYDTHGGMTDQKIELAIAPPGNRSDQIIYQDLRLRFANVAGAAPSLSVSTVVTSTALTSQVVTTAQVPYQVKVTAAVRLTDADGKPLYSGSLSQTADYNAGPQVLANNAALDDATKRAAHLLADTIRLTVLGALGR
jgi:hypothetical protein